MIACIYAFRRFVADLPKYRVSHQLKSTSQKVNRTLKYGNFIQQLQNFILLTFAKISVALIAKKEFRDHEPKLVSRVLIRSIFVAYKEA